MMIYVICHCEMIVRLHQQVPDQMLHDVARPLLSLAPACPCGATQGVRALQALAAAAGTAGWRRPRSAARRARAQVVKVVIPAAKEGRPHREFGFVHFAERATAVKLVDDAEKGTKPSLDGNTLEARRARQTLAPREPSVASARSPVYKAWRGCCAGRGSCAHGSGGVGTALTAVSACRRALSQAAARVRCCLCESCRREAGVAAPGAHGEAAAVRATAGRVRRRRPGVQRHGWPSVRRVRSLWRP